MYENFSLPPPGNPIDRKYGQKAREAKRVASARFLRSPAPRQRGYAYAASLVEVDPRVNVVGVGLGRMQGSGEPVVRLYVETKVDRRLLSEEDVLPEEIEGTRTEVIASGRFFAGPLVAAPQLVLPASISFSWWLRIFNQATQVLKKVAGTKVVGRAANDTVVSMARKQSRPVQPGCSVGFHHDRELTAGTLGAIVERGGERFILSNNHVIANENALPLGGLILQPGRLDGGAPPQCAIAELSRFVPLERVAPNQMDCAIATLLPNAEVDATFIPWVGRLGSPRIIEPSEHMRVHKVGRTTGWTRGEIFETDLDLHIAYPHLGTLKFEEQILIRASNPDKPFAEPGDSGSVIVHEASNQATALLLGVSQTFAIATPLERVMREFGVTLVA